MKKTTKQTPTAGRCFLRAWYSANSIHADPQPTSADSSEKTRAATYNQAALQSSDLFQDVIREELDYEFETCIKSKDFAETPNDLLKMVLGREPSAWPEFVKQLVPIYSRYASLIGVESINRLFRFRINRTNIQRSSCRSSLSMWSRPE